MINYSISLMSAQPGTNKDEITERKAYGVAQTSEILDINDFSRHIADHGSVYSRADIVAVLTLAVSCLREQMLAGKRVKLGDLGDFQAHIKCEGAASAAEFTAANIKAVNVRWTPGSEFKNLINDATFQLVTSRKAQADAIDEIKNGETVKGNE